MELDPILIVGIIIFTGFLLGEICVKVGLPKVTGYILAGIALNPGLLPVVPEAFVTHASLVTNIALAFITFSVGGTLSFSKIKSQGKAIALITLLEAECAFLCVAALFVMIGPMIMHGGASSLAAFYIPFALLLASLASPTDPSATLAVVHEYKAEGPVTSTIMGVAAFDDILGILNFSLAMSAAHILVADQSFDLGSIVQPAAKIAGAIGIGTAFGFFLNGLTRLISKESEGVLISLIIGLLSLCFGLAGRLGADELLATMIMGMAVVNFNPQQEKIFKTLERYTEELIFILFFTISAMNLDFSVLLANALAIILFVAARAMGKFGGTALGGKLAGAPDKVRKYTAGGLIPQGGIVIGLALVVHHTPAFREISTIILNVIIGATIIHEILGPVVSKFFIKKAGELKS